MFQSIDKSPATAHVLQIYNKYGIYGHLSMPKDRSSTHRIFLFSQDAKPTALVNLLCVRDTLPERFLVLVKHGHNLLLDAEYIIKNVTYIRTSYCPFALQSIHELKFAWWVFVRYFPAWLACVSMSEIFVKFLPTCSATLG